MEDLITHISNIYSLEAITTYSQVLKGYLTQNYILHTKKGPTYFLKKYRFTIEDQIKDVHTVKSFFCNEGIPVIMPMITSIGTTYFSHNNNYYALFPYVKAQELVGKTMSDKAIISMAEMLGDIHLLSNSKEIPAIKERLLEWNKATFLQKKEEIVNKISTIQNPTDFDVLALNNIEMKERELRKNSSSLHEINLPSHYLNHGDYLEANIFFGINDNISHIFDFEKTYIGTRMYEVFRSVLCAFLMEDTYEGRRKASVYIDAYKKRYPFTKEEIINGFELTKQKIFNSLWVLEEHYLKNNIKVDDLLVSDTARVTFIIEKQSEFLDMFF